MPKAFAKSVVLLCHQIKATHKEAVLTNQLLRSGASIGANLHEAQYAQGTKDFISKFEIALKECHECEFWLIVLAESCPELADEAAHLRQEAGSIRRMLISSITTLQKNAKK